MRDEYYNNDHTNTNTNNNNYYDYYDSIALNEETTRTSGEIKDTGYVNHPLSCCPSRTKGTTNDSTGKKKKNRQPEKR